jgi:hypothetical protein
MGQEPLPRRFEITCIAGNYNETVDKRRGGNQASGKV